MACITQFRIPEPIRQADLRSRALVKQFYDNVGKDQGQSKGKNRGKGKGKGAAQSSN